MGQGTFQRAPIFYCQLVYAVQNGPHCEETVRAAIEGRWQL